MKRILRLRVVLSALFIVSSIGAEGNYNELKQDDKKIGQDRKELRQTHQFMNRLSSAIDFWHDAYLEGDGRKISQYENSIFTIIEEDIRFSYGRVRKARGEAVPSRAEYREKEGEKTNRSDDKADGRDDRDDLAEVKNLLNIKKLLFQGLRKGETFGYKYRLLGDYQELLRRELGIDRLELAEDLKELDEERQDIVNR